MNTAGGASNQPVGEVEVGRAAVQWGRAPALRAATVRGCGRSAGTVALRGGSDGA